MREGYRMKLLPDDVRRAETGEAWVISHGQFAHLRVLQAETEPCLRQARALHRESAERGRAARVRQEGETKARPALEPPTFLDEL